ncbi:hypothetical protein [Nostoc sp.]|uniref:hypothetical protein n=1 Tax=Nostoc sp. TaxID=1180 RepID=UPI002FFA2CB2
MVLLPIQLQFFGFGNELKAIAGLLNLFGNGLNCRILTVSGFDWLNIFIDINRG